MKCETSDNPETAKFLRLLALVSIASLPFKSQIWLMSKAGFSPSQIAELLDSTRNTVNVRLSEIRKELKKRINVEEKNVRGARNATSN